MRDCSIVFFFFNDTATTEIYTLSLHDALPISRGLTIAEIGLLFMVHGIVIMALELPTGGLADVLGRRPVVVAGALLRSEEHTSELQSRQYIVCRLLLEKKKIQPTVHHSDKIYI